MMQPSMKSFHLFDTILLLSNGRVIYYGSVTDALPYFTTMPQAYDLSYYENPADFLVDVSGGYIPCKSVRILLNPSFATVINKDIIDLNSCD
jgi:ABC-type multidrug transport system ATPase subunit